MNLASRNIASHLVWPIFILIGCLYIYLGYKNPFVGFWADDALYLLMADIYSPYFSSDSPVYHEIRAIAHLPPAFPFLLGLLGGGSEQLPWVRVIVAVLMLCANLAYFLWLRTRGLRHSHAVLLAVLFSIFPITLFFVVDVWSESLYMLLVWITLMLLDKSNNTDEPKYYLLVACVTAALAIGTRTVGLALLPVLFIVGCRGGLKWLGMGSLVLALCLLLLYPLKMGGQDDTYTGILVGHYLNDPLGSVASIRGVTDALQKGFVYSLTLSTTIGLTLKIVLVTILLLGSIGIVKGIAKLELAVVYLITYILIITIWPFPDHIQRFFFPLIPLWLYFAYIGSEFVGRLLPPKANVTRGAFGYILLCYALVSPSWASIIGQLTKPMPVPELEDFKTTRYWLDAGRRETVRSLSYKKGLSDNIPTIADLADEDDCIYTVHTQIMMVLAKRQAWLPPKALTSSGEFAKCDYFYIVTGKTNSYPPMFPYEKIRHFTTLVATHRAEQSDDDAGMVVGLLFKKNHD